MRKITKKVAAAFVAGRKCTDGNTSTDGRTLWLHGNAVARKVETAGKDRLEICWAGWLTSTTAERVNGVLAEVGSAFRIGRKNFAAHVWAKGVCTPMDSNTWQAVTDAKLPAGGVK